MMEGEKKKKKKKKKEEDGPLSVICDNLECPMTRSHREVRLIDFFLSFLEYFYFLFSKANKSR